LSLGGHPGENSQDGWEHQLLRSAGRSADREIKLLGELLMKKHLIAAAVAAAVAAPAMAQEVQIYGILSTAYSQTELEASGGGSSVSLKSTTSGAQGQQAGNRLGFRGTEDLGGGLKAGFVYELGADLNSGLAGNRLGYVQLQGGFGTVRLGRVDSLTRSIYNGFAHGNSGFAPGNVGASFGVFGQVVSTLDLRGCGSVSANDPGNRATCATNAARVGWGGTRVADSIGYISPNLSGFTLQAQFGKTGTDRSANADKNESNVANVGVSYAAGPLALSAARDTDKINTEGAASFFPSAAAGDALKLTTDMLSASYDFGAARLFYLYSDKEWKANAGKLTAKVHEIGVQVPVGALQLVATYSDGSLKDGTSKEDISAYQLQANYSMSKRTRLFAMYGETELKDSGAKLSLDGFSLGVQHSF
jgi:predicted porin